VLLTIIVAVAYQVLLMGWPNQVYTSLLLLTRQDESIVTSDNALHGYNTEGTVTAI
jgi:hypothetical protein